MNHPLDHPMNDGHPTRDMIIHRMASFMPAMNPDDKKRLRTSLKTHGYQGDPILVVNTPDGPQIIDGRNRYLACKDLNIEPHIRVVEWDEDRIRREVWNRNIIRRQATKQEIVAATIAFHPDMATSDITAITGVSDTTVRKVRHKVANNPERIDKIKAAVRSGASVEKALKPTTEERVKQLEERSALTNPHLSWKPRITPKILVGFELWAARAGYSSSQKALSAVLSLLGTAAKNDETKVLIG